ncbi:collagen binding domain-containing protein [Streptomyces sp. NPDC050504]|uniref:collagen binding domain-containing protein n=1 Tax=Streptomyces sp. NPDC050504 TaxID=3365618 RepID=UPI00378DDADA
MKHPPGPGPRRSSRWAAAAALLLVTPSLVGAALPNAPAARADGSVTVTVVRDVDSDGSWTPALEVGERGIPVTITDASGKSATVPTGSDGKAVFDPAALGLSGGRYRVEAAIPADRTYLQPAMAGGPAPSLSSLVEFVDVSGGQDAEVLTGVHNPADYCDANPDLATPCSRQDAVGTVGTKALVSWPYDRTGQEEKPNDEATFEKIGSAYGLAHKRDTDQLFVGALTKRLIPYGPAGPGGIYVVDRKTKQTSLFTTVPDAGDAVHAADLKRDSMEINDAVGKEGLGDLDISEDGKTLYAVGLKAKSLYAYDTTAASPAPIKQTIPIPDPGCPSGADDWRPYGLGIHDGAIYVGGTCSAESTQKREDLRAYVLKLEGTSFSTVVSNNLAYERGMGYSSVKGDTHWEPWLKTWDPYGWFVQANFPGPMLSDIVFDRDGSMVLGFRDRLGDQAGHEALAPEGSTDTATRSLFPAMGDITRVCKTEGGWVWDSESPACPSHFVNGSQPPQQDDVPEYYPADSVMGQHAESVMGGLAFAPRFTDTAAVIVDPLTIFSGGTRKFNNLTGEGSGDYEIDGGTGSFGKANTLGDLTLLCDEAPIQIGNRVWYDSDKDGVQGPDEKPVPGATVNLYDENGTLVATTTTTDRGEYYFDSVKDGLKPNTKYVVKIDNPADYAEGGPLHEWVVTQNDEGDNDSVDSDGKVPSGGTYPEHSLTTGAAGHNDHTFDFGFMQPEGEVRVLKTDADTGEPLAGAEFQLWRETNGTDGLQTDGDTPDTKVGDEVTSGADGLAKVAEQPLGSYYWQETKAPAGYTLPDPAVFGPLQLTADNAADGVQITVEDQPVPVPVKGRASVVKVDAQTKETLSGAGFQLWHETNGEDGLQTEGTADTEVGAVCTTDSKGTCTRDDLELGTYYWQETKAPAGYTLPDPAVFGPLEVTRANAEAGVTVTVEDQPMPQQVTGKARVLKVDAKTAKALPGGVFQLWHETNGKDGLQTSGTPDAKVGAACTTDSKGVCSRDGLVLGTYYWQETKAPAGYALPKPNVFGPLEVTRANAEAGVTVTVANQAVPPRPKLGRITLVKKDAKTGRPLPGAVFELWQETNGRKGLQTSGSKPDRRTGPGCATNSRGTCTYQKLPLGSYYLRETGVPEGYVLPRNPVSGPHAVTAKNADRGVKVVRTNKRGEEPKKK